MRERGSRIARLRSAAIFTGALVAIAALAVGVARAWVPASESLAELLAERNRSAQRTQALRLAVVVKEGDGTVIARGVATAEPGGGARLRLTYRSGAEEIQERNGSEYRIEPPPSAGQEYPLLPPFAFLQAGSPERILGLLRGLGGEVERVDLGIDGNRDCWVVGGRTSGRFDDNHRPALWIALESRELVRIDTAEAVAYRIGPTAAFGGIHLPKWIEVRPRDAETLRLEIEALAAPD
jgi:hypothetical protein